MEKQFNGEEDDIRQRCAFPSLGHRLVCWTGAPIPASVLMTPCQTAIFHTSFTVAVAVVRAFEQNGGVGDGWAWLTLAYLGTDLVIAPSMILLQPFSRFFLFLFLLVSASLLTSICLNVCIIIAERLAL